MANIIMQGRSKLGDALSFVNDLATNEALSTIMTSEANKAWRAKILLDRLIRHGGKEHFDKTKPNERVVPQISSDFKEVKGSFDHRLNRIAKEAIKYNVNNPLLNISFQYPYINKDGTIRTLGYNPRPRTDESILIVNECVSPAQAIVLQTVPKELDFQNESTWAVIHSIGRNTPMYHYTGAESVIQMNISWYCNDKQNPEEVVAKCRLLEAWTKANGYNAAPPVLKIQWGSSDLFKDHLFILTAATYKLSNWRAGVMVRTGNNKWATPQGYEKPKMYPATATQELIFRRVSAKNLNYDDIVPSTWLTKTRGIN